MVPQASECAHGRRMPLPAQHPDGPAFTRNQAGRAAPSTRLRPPCLARYSAASAACINASGEVPATACITPMLVVTGQKDFRVPYSQGLASFTALQEREIPSQLLVFPDENHWVLKPQNGILWQREFFGWLDKWLK